MEHDIPDGGRDSEDLMDANTAFVTVFAFIRGHRPIEGNVVERNIRLQQFFVLKGFERSIEFFIAGNFCAHGLIHRVLFLAVAQPAYKPLSDDNTDGRDQKEWFNAHIYE